MTDTGRWLERRGRALKRRVLGAGAALIAGSAMVAMGGGIVLGRVGAYRSVPPLVLVSWVAAAAVVALGVAWLRRRLGDLRTPMLAREVERDHGLRHGSMSGVVAWTPAVGSPALAALADRRAASWLGAHEASALAAARSRTGRSLGAGTVVLAVGMLFFGASGPRSNGAAQFWRPVHTLSRGRGPVELAVDRLTVRRGDSVRVTVTAAGRNEATLLLRAPGETWSARSLSLDSSGVHQLVLGPLDSDRFLQALSGGRASDTVHVRVLVPPFLTGLSLVARAPAYTGLPEQPISPGPDTLRLPNGTSVFASGRVSLPIQRVEWRSGPDTVRLVSEGSDFSGDLTIRSDATWELFVTTANAGPLAQDPPRLTVVAVPDQVPLVAVPVPGGDGAAPPSLQQPLVIDAQDDYGLTKLDLVSWRVSGAGSEGEPQTEEVALAEQASDRVVLQWLLDLEGRGFLPGDTAYVTVRAWDNAPRPQMGASETFKLWLPSLSELRDAVREQTDAVGEGADSLARAQEELAREAEDLAAARERAAELVGTGQQEGDLPFNSVERAQELADRQEAALERADQLRQQLEALSETAWSAGLTDPAFHEQVEELRKLLEQALTDEMRERLDALRESIERLDAEAVREALQQLAEQADRLREQLERGRELFERAAIEGDLASLAKDAEELAGRQQDWNDRAASEGTPDSTLAAQEQALAEMADSLAADLAQLSEMMERAETDPQASRQSGERAERAAGRMDRATAQAQAGERQDAAQSGREASQSLDPLASELREQRDQLREAWREEVLDAMDRALVETARLAERQGDVAERMSRGEAGGGIRGEQAALRSGVERLMERLQNAAGKNALVSPQLGTALGLARLRMSEALDQLTRANPNTRQAGELAGEAVDGLNALAHALLRSQSDVAEAQSGSGLSEAVERMAQLAEQQGQLNNATSGMLSMMPTGSRELMQQLQGLAQRQRDLADELERLQAEGEVSGAGEMAEEAQELARTLEAAQLQRETIERQERLFRRLLDAGRTLRSDEEDEREERVSETADPTNVQLPPAVIDRTTGGPRFRYPTWEALRSLSPEERRLVLDYFRRLNERRP